MSGKLLKSTAVVSFMTLLSRISGLVRDVVFARFFGADGTTDAFFVAFKIPNLLRRQFAEGAFSQAFVPVFTEYKTKREHDEVKKLAANVAGTLGGVLCIVTVIGVVAAPILVLVFAPGWAGGDSRYELTTEMLRFTFPYILFISLTALAGGILNAYGQFAIPSITPILLNICMIAAAVWLSPVMEEPIIALAIGVFIAGVVQLVFQFPFLFRLRLFSLPRWAWHDPGVRKVRTLMIPALFSSSVQQINLLFDFWIASFLVAGSISWLYYADRLVEFPFGIFGVAIATVILPSLSVRHANDDPKQFSHMLDWALRLTLLIGAPAALGLVALSGPLIITIFQYGKFSEHDLYMTQLALIAYSVGLLGFMCIKVLSPGYFARQNTKTPMKIAIQSMLVKVVFTVILVSTMMMLAYEAPHMGLALSTALSAILQSTLLYRGLRRDGVYKPDLGWAIFLLRIGAACVIMGLVLYFGVESNAVWMQWSVYERVLNVLLWVSVGGIAYFASLVLMGMKLKELVRHKT
ncbi:MAG: murein biosynthesis integral membrane protein MurJ [Gammaproteobacteria bacterium]|nr:murein biosynthesis integral membrane protein MurJ [Gammaproteobacteria bacterium]